MPCHAMPCHVTARHMYMHDGYVLTTTQTKYNYGMHQHSRPNAGGSLTLACMSQTSTCQSVAIVPILSSKL